ncbi:ThuA domain-containing protein [Microbacterium halophytorum]|uniref:ThuA domain-containing protein n=1 Tax=Microbacterium halophytorum TaxID=2067568 RepID=UPI000CFD2B6B|nr:ThuA domain-containing protein [Microbacterium halophytorum]
MNRRTMRAGTLVAAAGTAAGLLLAASPVVADEGESDGEYKVLVVGETKGFRHSHIPHTITALIEAGEDRGFTVDVWDSRDERTLTENPFSSTENLQQYSSIVFDSPVDGTNANSPASASLLSPADVSALQGYVRGGGGVLGLHAATDTMHNVPWYTAMMGGGAEFLGHPRQQEATMVVENTGNLSVAHLPTEWTRYDEWYSYTVNPRENVNVLITLDEDTYEPGGLAMGDDHPLSWCQNFEGGRTWYEGAGHVDEAYSDPDFMEHILVGLEWTAGVIDDIGGGNCVTFREVDGIVDGLSDGSPRAEKLSAQVADYLEAAQEKADSGDHAAAIRTLTQARGKSHGLQDDVLAEKIDDLIEWQGVLAES